VPEITDQENKHGNQQYENRRKNNHFLLLGRRENAEVLGLIFYPEHGTNDVGRKFVEESDIDRLTESNTGVPVSLSGRISNRAFA
jgi:hypothetical protein